MARAGKYTVWEEEIETPDDWKKCLQHEGLLVVQLYTSFYGPCDCIYPGVDRLVKVLKKEKKSSQIIWRRIDIQKIEENNRLHRIESPNNEDGNKELCDADLVEGLEPYKNFNHPQPLIFFYLNSVLMEIVRQPNVPLICTLVKSFLSEEETSEPNPDMHFGEIVVGADEMWDPEKEAEEKEQERCAELTKRLLPIFNTFFWFWKPEDVFNQPKEAEEFCSFFTIGKTEKEQDKNTKELMDMFVVGEQVGIVMEKIIHHPELKLIPGEDLQQIESHMETLDHVAEKETRLSLILEMLEINLNTSNAEYEITGENLDSIKARLNKCLLKEDVGGLDVLLNMNMKDAQNALLPILSEQTLFSLVRNGLTMLFQTERIKTFTENLLAFPMETEDKEAEPVLMPFTEAMDEEKVRQVLTTLLGEEEAVILEECEGLSTLFDKTPSQFASMLEHFDFITPEIIMNQDIEINESKFKSLMNMDTLYYQFSKISDKSIVDDMHKGIVRIEDIDEDILEFQLNLISVTNSMNHIVINHYPNTSLNHYLSTHKSKFTTVELNIMPTELVEVLTQQQKISDLRVNVMNNETSDFLSQYKLETIRSLTLTSKTGEVDPALQSQIVEFVKEHNISQFTSNLAFKEKNAKALFADLQECQKIDLRNPILIKEFLSYPEIDVKMELLFSSNEILFTNEIWELMMIFLRTTPKLPNLISFTGVCEVENERWEEFLTHVSSNPGCERLTFMETGIHSEQIGALTQTLNTRPQISDLHLVDKNIGVDDIEDLLSNLNEERDFDLNCNFGDLVNHKKFYNMASEIHHKFDWLVIEDIIFSSQDITPVPEEINTESEDKKPVAKIVEENAPERGEDEATSAAAVTEANTDVKASDADMEATSEKIQAKIETETEI